ncbi:MAG: ComEC/Rec2 family competence protein, partial [Chloroflexota bacterium]
VVLDVLLPPSSYRAGEVASNDDSLAVRLRYGEQAMLLSGDTEARGEEWLLNHHVALASQLLKVGHHGSHTSSTPGFVAAVQPQVAVISVGRDNLYGHPAPVVVERLAQEGARVFRTDRDGAVQCRMDGTWLRIFLFHPPLGLR